MNVILDINCGNPIPKETLLDKAAFCQIYKFLMKDMRAYGLSLTSTEEHVRDAIQDVFFRIYEKPRDFENLKQLKFFLLHSLRNRIYDIYRKDRRLTGLDDFTLEVTVHPSTLENILEKEEQKMLRQKVARLLDKLSGNQKEIIYLHYMQGMSYKEIATMMNAEPTAIRKVSSRAIQKLRKEELSVSFLLLFLSDILK